MVFLAEDGGIGALGINLPSLIAQLINFTLLLIIIGWASKRFLFPLLDERRKRIREGLEASEEAKRRLSETETEVAAELEKARQEGQSLIGQAQQMSARIQEEARQSARAEGEKLLERARSEIQLERDAAIAIGNLVGRAMEALGRNPEAQPVIQTNMILGLAFAEAIGIYALVTAVMIGFVF